MHEFLEHGPLLLGLASVPWSERPELPEKPADNWREEVATKLFIAGFTALILSIGIAGFLHAAGDKQGFMIMLWTGVAIFSGCITLASYVAVPNSAKQNSDPNHHW